MPNPIVEANLRFSERELWEVTDSPRVREVIERLGRYRLAMRGQRDRADEAEARVAGLEAALKSAKAVVDDYFHPHVSIALNESSEAGRQRANGTLESVFYVVRDALKGKN